MAEEYGPFHLLRRQWAALNALGPLPTVPCARHDPHISHVWYADDPGGPTLLAAWCPGR